MPAYRPAFGALVSTCAATLAVAVFVFPGSIEPEPPDMREERDTRRLTIPFVQTATTDGTAYVAATFAGTVHVQPDGAIAYALPGGITLRERPAGDATCSVRGGEASATRVNVIRGPDPAAWRTGLQTFANVEVDELAPGVRLDVAAGARNVEKRFHVAPGAAVDTVRMRFEGDAELDVLADGRLTVANDAGSLTFTAPVAFQDTARGRRHVDARYVVVGDTYGFDVRGHDPALPLVIDPLIASTYLSGWTEGANLLNDELHAIAAHDGSVYVAGSTQADIFPNGFDDGHGHSGTYAGGWTDTVVCRLSPDLTTVEAATFLGGSENDVARAIAVTADGVFVTGLTTSPDFPTTAAAVQPTQGDGGEVFVSRFTLDLATLTASTYLGGTSTDEARDILVDPQLGVIVTGRARSPDLGGHVPSTAYQPANAGVFDAFVVRLAPDLGTVLAATLLGGTWSDEAAAVCVDGSDILICGTTSSTDLPVPPTAFDTNFAREEDGFVARFDGALRQLRACTYLGGEDAEYPTDDCLDVAVHDGDVLVCGETESFDFPRTLDSFDPSPNGDGEYLSADAFVVRLSSDLTDLEAGTFVGGTGSESVGGMAVNEDGIVLVGTTRSDEFPVGPGSEDDTLDGTADAFVFMLSHDLTTRLDGRFVGGTDRESASQVVLVDGVAFVCGDTTSRDFPTTEGAFDREFEDTLSRTDGFVISYDLFEGGVTPPPTEIDAYILPKRLDVKHKGAKSKLNAGGWFDSGSGEVDWSLPATLTIGEETFPIPGLTLEKKRKGWWAWSNDTMFFRIKPSRYGSSKGKFKLKRQGAELEAIPLDEPLVVRFQNNDVDAVGEVTLKEGRYKLGRQRGALIQPRLALYSCKTTLKGDDKDGLRARLGIATDEGTPHECPPIKIGLDDQFVDTLPSDVFDLRKRKFVFKGPKGGLSKAIVDFGKEKLAIHGKKIDAGQYPEGPQAVDVLVQVGDDALLLKVRMVRKGKTMRY